MRRGRPADGDAPPAALGAAPGRAAPHIRRIARLAVPGLFALIALLAPLSASRSLHPRSFERHSGISQSVFQDVFQDLPNSGNTASKAHIGALATRVLQATNEVWAALLPQQKRLTYTPPQLVLYDDATRSACGPTFTAIGPFYCPLDRKIYLDASFFKNVGSRLGGNGELGDLAYTFLLAHEVGHHVQNELGILRQAQAVRRSAFGLAGNPILIRIELMADCYAGVWAAAAEATYHLIGRSDIAKLRATAQAIGDDRLEQAAQGMIVAATFTHGTSAQRAHWFDIGLKSGKLDSCNTFAGVQ